MKHATAFVLSLVLVCLAAAQVFAHPATFKGTVVEASATRITVNVKDEKTGKVAPESFDIDKETKILRGDKVVTFAAAAITKGEIVSVTVNTDDGAEGIADVIRLDARK